MPVYGFNNRSTAQKLKRMAEGGRRGGEQTKYPQTRPVSSRIYVATPDGTIPAATQVTIESVEYIVPGEGTAILRQRNTDSEAQDELIKRKDEKDNEVSVTVWNLGDEIVEDTDNPQILILVQDRWGDLYITGGEGCEDRNEQWALYFQGPPTGGTITLLTTVNGSAENLTFDYDATAAEVQTEFETHTEIASGDVEVSGGPLPSVSIQIEFKGDLAGKLVPIPPTDISSLSGTGIGAVLIRTERGLPGDATEAP